MSKIRTKVAAAVVVAGAAVSSMLVGAVPASAAPTRPCPANYYCFYENAEFGGWHLNYNTTPSGEFNNPPNSSGDKRNQLSSIINNGSRTICVFDRRAGRSDPHITVGPYQDYRNLAVINFNDKADYWRVGPCP